MKRCIPMMVLAILTGLVVNAWAVSIAINPVHDLRIESRTDLADGHKNASLYVVGGDNINDFQRSILRFDLTGLTGMVASTDGNLKLEIPLSSGFNGQQMDLFKIKSANAGWLTTSGTNGAAAAGDATWNNLAHPSTAWTGGAGLGAPGTGGYEGATSGSATPLDTYVGAGEGVGDFVNLTIPKSVLNEWISNSGGNAGLIMKVADEAGLSNSFVRFYSTDATAGSKPLLTFEAAVPEPSSLLLAGMGLAGLLCCLWRKRTRKA